MSISNCFPTPNGAARAFFNKLLGRGFAGGHVAPPEALLETSRMI
jgi:hypothetical protein